MFFRLTPWILPLSALLSLVLGTSTLSELSSLGYAVPDHSSAPHNILELHNARVRSAAGPSLVAGVDTPPEPVSKGWFHALVQRCNPSRSGICSLGGVRGTRARLSMQWRSLTVFGLDVPAVVVRASRHCKKQKVTVSHLQVVVGSLPSDLISRFTWDPSRRRQRWENVAGCAVVGWDSRGVTRMACTTAPISRKQHILQFCGPVGRTAQCPRSLTGSSSLVARQVSTSTHQYSTF